MVLSGLVAMAFDIASRQTIRVAIGEVMTNSDVPFTLEVMVKTRNPCGAGFKKQLLHEANKSRRVLGIVNQDFITSFNRCSSQRHHVNGFCGTFCQII